MIRTCPHGEASGSKEVLQKMMRPGVIVLVVTLAMAMCCQASDASPVTACAAVDDSPPYLFTEKGEGLAKDKGLGIDVLQAVFLNLNLGAPQLRRLPWARCLQEVALGNIDLAINIPTAQVDPSPYWVSRNYVEVHSVFIYSKTVHPQGMTINDLHELKQFRVCGLLGTRYDAYGISVDNIDFGPNDYFSLFRKINAGRCDLAVERSAVIDSLLKRDKALRALFDANHLAQDRMPEDDMLGLHFIISRKLANGEGLRNSINEEIRKMRQSHQLEKMLMKYSSAP